MPEYHAPLRDMRFLLHDLFDAPARWAGLPALAGQVDADTADAILEEAARVISGRIAPLNRAGDETGALWQAGEVTTPPGFRDAYATFSEGGWIGLAGNPDFGGMGMPKMLSVHCEEMLYAANSSFALYATLTSGACLAIDTHASAALKQQYLPKLYSGEWSGAMCLTEAHAGSDLGLIRTRAEPDGEGQYRLSGSKIFITGGEHDLTTNIIHLVLARLPDAPAGPKGISLFLVPKYLPATDGQAGERNAVQCGAIEHKMGIKASATCVMHFDQAIGYLVGEPHQGLAAMFTMMNYERLSIGIQGIGCADQSLQVAAGYARERRQGRAPGTTEQADAIIRHPDVRRMLLTMKALTEGGRAFATYVGLQLDLSKFSDDDSVRAHASARVALLTPVAKAFFTDTGLESCVHGQQVLGGHGYVREWGQEQLVRDVRIAQIYEGTNGIQALDLLGRKVIADRGAALHAFIDEMRADTAQHTTFRAPLNDALDRLQQVSDWLIEQAAIDPMLINASAVEYLHLFGYVTYAWLWARMADAADRADGDADFLAAKRATAGFFFQRLLPRILSLEATLKNGSASLTTLPANQF
ncbi:acyl-CoA dehydrogenase [Alcanivorax sp. S71-1-4]|uniref:acyl-CoA dehydrogenase C-terminal domain-containing protein n=1 Tax=Alcanivorax sp. S71-1-4 TaxID=1177159 RepID=UPI00135A8211|nr:acyl-CoA dehydrogenase C-terminal domain-containing protein [Alcanivorax sp. S71-1-4]KAF0808746.1 acyl-CoA dehydrogenase [Alcanivorax sp. S71-1-4]